jgi:hypothetical protein
LVSCIQRNLAREVQGTRDWLAVCLLEPGSTDAKALFRPGCAETEFNLVSGEPGSRGASTHVQLLSSFAFSTEKLLHSGIQTIALSGLSPSIQPTKQLALVPSPPGSCGPGWQVRAWLSSTGNQSRPIDAVWFLLHHGLAF